MTPTPTNSATARALLLPAQTLPTLGNPQGSGSLLRPNQHSGHVSSTAPRTPRTPATASSEDNPGNGLPARAAAPLPGYGVGPVLSPAVLVAFVDRAGLQ
jgi:hypothetical protein